MFTKCMESSTIKVRDKSLKTKVYIEYIYVVYRRHDVMHKGWQECHHLEYGHYQSKVIYVGRYICKRTWLS